MRFAVLPIFFLLASFSVLAQGWQRANDEGMVHYRNGHYKEAENLFLKAMEKSARSPGRSSVAFLTSLTNLAYAQQMQGDFEKSCANFRRALALTNALYPGIQIDKIEASVNLGNAFLPAGQYDSSEYYLASAKELIVQAAKERARHYTETIHRFFEALISVQNSLASLYYKKGLTYDAIHLLEQQRLDIRTSYPNDYTSLPMYQNTINNLATYYMEVGDYKKAKPMITEQIHLASANADKQREFLYALNNLGSIYRLTDQTDSAALTWKRASAIISSGRFAGSDLHISILNNQGEMAFSLEEYDEALRILRQSLALQQQRAALNPRIYQTTLLNLCETYFWMGNLEDADKSYQDLREMLVNEILHNFSYLSDKEKIAFYRSNLSILEYYKYFSFEAVGAFLPAKDSSRYVSVNGIGNLFDLLLSTKGLILHPGYRLRTAILKSQNTRLKNAYETWEKNKYEYATLTRSENADKTELARLLGETEEMEKWLRNNSSEFRRGFVMEQKSWRDIRDALSPGEAAVEIVRLVDGLVYGALIVTSETTEAPQIALMKSTRSLHLEKQYYKQYANCIAHNLTDTLSYGVYWKPVMDAVRAHTRGSLKPTRIYLSPDGIYNRINVNTLLNPETNKYVIDETEIRILTNARDILPSDKVAGKSTAVLLGRPQYFMEKEDQGNTLPDLAGTEREIDEIDLLLRERDWTTTVLKHREANEVRIKDAGSPKVLHLATHGFSSNKGNDASSMVDDLLNSGIVLAGGGDKTISGGEDGILTAYEMMNIDLDSTSLVVLSACETGLGEFHTGEGIYGLQAALRSAGAKSLIMSLWKVDDAATQQLMVNFYRYWLENPNDPHQSFRKAQQKLMTIFPDPYYWGAFVMTGK